MYSRRQTGIDLAGLKTYCGLILIYFVATLLGCATPPPVEPSKPAGPSAMLWDSAKGGGANGGAFFIVEEINGNKVAPNTLQNSLRLSHGQGRHLSISPPVYRYAPAGMTRLKIAGQYAHAAPIQSLWNASSSYSVSGEIVVDLRLEGRYRVNGNLDAFRREVWLEDEASGLMIGQKIISVERSAEVQKAMVGASFTCCNLRYSGDWISDNNAATLPFVPVGTKIAIREYGSNRAHVYIDGRPMRIGHDYGRKQESLQKYVGKLLVAEDPKIRIAAYPALVRAAIEKGKVSIGMTREQVIASLGHPRADVTTDLANSEWKYWTADDEEFVLQWGTDGRVREVDGSRKAKAQVVHSE